MFVSSKRRDSGLTLLELCIVIVIIGLVAGITVPYLLPLALSSELETEARKLAYFGRAILSTSSLFGDKFYAEIDLDQQKYYCVKVTEPEPIEGEVDQLSLLNNMRAQGMGNEQIASLFAPSTAKDADSGTAVPTQTPEGFDTEKASQQINSRFDRLMRRRLLQQAKNVKHKDNLLEEIGSLFDEGSEVDIFGVEPQIEEVNEPGLSPVTLSENVWIENVIVGTTTYSKGLVEIEISPLGLGEVVVFYLRNTNGEYYTVVWDPVITNAYVLEGKQ